MPDVRIAKILHAVNEDTGAGYFLKLVKALNEICGFDHAFVGQVDTKEKTVTTRAYVSKGEILANVTYDLVDSPCEQILDRSYCRFSEGVADVFPKDLMLADLNIKGYVGYPLLSQAGEPIGILVLLHESPIENVDTIFDLLRYFARHCECELERMTL
ncbi:MAG: GAF domain-containing protein [Kordiimonadaceae bacterium]|nr:GAF domain-containing protein [Kordiimonadaceae bacterium]